MFNNRSSQISKLRGLGKWGMAGALTYQLVRWAIEQKRYYSFRDRNVLITGGSRGLGLLIARQLATENARLAICARDPEELAAAHAELSGSTAVYASTCDLTDANQIDSFVQAAKDEIGPIDVLIHNAGIIQVGPVEAVTIRDLQEAMEVHFWAAMRLARAVLPDMLWRKQGRIVNIASIGGKVAVPHLLPYSASKFALVGFSKALHCELLKEGIYVTTVSPGLMRTGSPRHAIVKGDHESEYAWFSIGDSLPLLSMNAENAARKILNATRYGRAEAVLGWPAKLATFADAIAPELTADLLGLVSQMLPQPTSGSTRGIPGFEATSAWSPSLLTTLTEQAARENNEILSE